MKKIVFVFFILLFIGILGVAIFAANFQLFGEPSKEVIISSKKDSTNKRIAILAESEGNATLNSALKLYISNIHNMDNHKELIFTISSGYTNKKDIFFFWKSKDTLVIGYNKDYDIFAKEFKTNTINPEVKIQYLLK